MANFKKGLLFGSLLGAGLVWLNTTKRGRELRDEALTHAQVVYERVKKEARKAGGWDKLSKTRFNELVADISEKYAREIHLTERLGHTITKVVQGQWKRLKKDED